MNSYSGYMNGALSIFIISGIQDELVVQGHGQERIQYGPVIRFKDLFGAIIQIPIPDNEGISTGF